MANIVFGSHVKSSKMTLSLSLSLSPYIFLVAVETLVNAKKTEDPQP